MAKLRSDYRKEAMQGSPLSQALRYSYARQKAREEEEERQRAETQAAIDKTIRPTVSQAAPKTEADRMTANRRAVDLHRRADAVRQRTPRASQGKLETAKPAAAQARARQDAEARLRTVALLGRPTTAPETGSTISRGTGGQAPKPVGSVTYTGRRFAHGFIGAVGGAEDAARTMVAEELRRRGQRADENLVQRLFASTVKDPVRILAKAQWDPKADLGTNVANALITGGELANRMLTTPPGFGPVREIVLGDLIKALGAREGKSAREESEALTRELMTGKTGVDSVYDRKSHGAALDYQRQYQRLGAQMAGDVSQVVGAMAPSLLTGGTVSPAAGLTMLGLSAGGDQARMVYEATGDVDKAWRAGLGTGLKEAGTEILLDGMGGLLGKGVLSKPLAKLTAKLPKSGMLRYLSGVLEESGEEILGGWAQTFIDRATWDPDAEMPTWQDLGQQAGMAAIVSSIFHVPVMFRGGRMQVDDRGELSAAQKERIDAQAAADRTKMQKAIDRAADLSKEWNHWREKLREADAAKDAEAVAEYGSKLQAVSEEIKKANGIYQEGLEELARGEGTDVTSIRPGTKAKEADGSGQLPASERAAEVKRTYTELTYAWTALETARENGGPEDVDAAEGRYAEALAAYAKAAEEYQSLREAVRMDNGTGAAGIDPSTFFRTKGPETSKTAAAVPPMSDTATDATSILPGVEPRQGRSGHRGVLTEATRKSREVRALADLSTAARRMMAASETLETARATGDAQQTAVAEQRYAEAEAAFRRAKADVQRVQAEAAAARAAEPTAAGPPRTDTNVLSAALGRSEGLEPGSEPPPPLPEPQTVKQKPYKEELQEAYREEGVTEDEDEDETVNEGKSSPMELPGVREMQQEVEAGEAAAGDDRLDPGVAKSLTGKGVKKTRDLWRNLKNAAGKVDNWDQETKTGHKKREKAQAKGDTWKESGREQADVNARELNEKITKPYWKAKRAYQKATEQALDKLAEISERYHIKKGSKASAAVQWIGEGERIVKIGKDEAGNQVVETEAYTEQDLRREFGEKRAEEIMGAANAVQKELYDPYVKRVNAVLSEIYPDPEGDIQRRMAAAQATIDRCREGLKSAEGAQKAQLEKELKNATKRYNSLAKQYNSGDYMLGKRLIPRKSYFHHFQELEKGLGAIDRLIEGSQAINPQLVGTSEWTQPKTKYWGSLQHRLGGKYNADAIGGLQKYIPAAEYRIAWNPFVTHMRGIIFGLAEDTQNTRNCNDLIQWLTDWTNDIAGKTNPWDRWLVQSNTGRKIIAVLRVASNRIRGNMVTLNVRSALAQASNIGTAANYVTDPADWAKGLAFVSKKFGNEDIGFLENILKTRFDFKIGENFQDIPVEDSPFLGERYLEKKISSFDAGIVGNAEKLAATTLRFLDRRATYLIWSAAYYQGQRLGISESELVQYADEVAIKSTGGRGVGEAPLAMKSEIIKLLQPFFLEANNAMQAAWEMTKDAAFLKILLSMGTNWLMNEILRQLFGFDVTWDPIDAGIEAIKTWRDSPEDDRTAWKLLTQIGKNELGELASNTFLGPLIAQQAFPDEADRKIVFGDRDPLQYGNQNVAVKAVTAPLTRAIAGKDFSDELLNTALMFGLPVGGRSVERVISEAKRRTGWDPVLQIGGEGGTKIFSNPHHAPGTSYDKRGNVRYPLEEGAWPTVRGAAFGEWTTDAGKAYLKGGSKSLSEANSRDYERLVDAGLSPQQAWDVIQGILASKARKDRDGMIYYSTEKWWSGYQKMDSVQKEIAAEVALRSIDPDRLEKAEKLKSATWVGLADLLEYGETGNAKEARAWLEQSSLSRRQKEYLYTHPLVGQERAGSYSQWEAAKAELADNKLYKNLSPEGKEELLKKCLEYAPGENATADAAVVAGWKLSEYYLYAEYASRLHADKDASGKTISGSAKEKKIYMMEQSGLSKGKQALFLLLSEGYKLDADMMAAANDELAKMKLSKAELEEIAEVCKCKVGAGNRLVR